ncbi:hypothetical protein [Metabacillus sp. RGM 3146]|uniref:hypothetical protein n=1 Tax=Metabacillus sp. RGM 3146 TaxID=3401092 RepID=UPI003B9C3365
MFTRINKLLIELPAPKLQMPMLHQLCRIGLEEKFGEMSTLQKRNLPLFIGISEEDFMEIARRLQRSAGI